MTAAENHLLQLTFSLLLVLPTSYAVGRVHQWYTHSLRRDAAFRQGYDDASHSMFDLATQQRVAVRQAAAATAAEPAARFRRHGSGTPVRTLRTAPFTGVPSLSAEHRPTRLPPRRDAAARRLDASPR